MLMLFKERNMWANKYKEWLEENKDVADTPLTVISYLVAHDWRPKTTASWERIPRIHALTGESVFVYECSNCYEQSDIPSPYCPDCGAKMQKEEINAEQ